MRGRVLLLLAVAGGALAFAAPELASRFVHRLSPPDVARFVVAWTKAFLHEGRGVIRDPADCRTALARTTSCHGEDGSWQECHYHYRAEGVPDPRVCAAFVARPWTSPPAARAAAPLGIGLDGVGAVGGAGSGPAVPLEERLQGCLETSPVGWERVPCERVHLDPHMACFRCDDGRLEQARTIVQAFDRTCAHAVVVKTCNEPLP